MAKFETAGFEEIEKQFLRRAENAVKAVPRMLQKGAQVLAEAQRREIEQMDIVDKGELMRSVKPTKVKQKDECSYIDVYPQGTDSKGVRNAEKGFIAQYGKSNEPARPWMTAANAKSADAVHDAMWQEWEQVNNEG